MVFLPLLEEYANEAHPRGRFIHAIPLSVVP